MNRELTEEERGAACACSIEECLCTDVADFVNNGTFICGCCFGDCPDVHPERHKELMLRLKSALAEGNFTTGPGQEINFNAL